MMAAYIVLEAPTTRELEDKVVRAVADGLTPLGGVAAVQTYEYIDGQWEPRMLFLQAVVRVLCAAATK